MGNLPYSVIWEATLRSLGIAGAVALLAGFLGILMAWLVSRTDFPGRRALSGILAVPYALPSYLLGMAWVVLGNPSVGLLRDFLPQQGSYGFWGIVFVEACVAFAFPYLELRAGFERMDPALEEAARMSGARPWRVFKDVSFPLLWPALLNGMALAFLYAMAAFGVPALLGLPVREFVLTTLIYSQIRLGGIDGIWVGLQLSGLLLLLSVAVLTFTSWLARVQRRRGAIAGAKASRPSRVDLARWSYGASLFSWSLIFVTVALPWIALGMSALAPVAGKFDPSLWTLRNLVGVLSMDDFRQALVNSAGLTLGAATLIVGGGFLLGFFAVRRRSRIARSLIEVLGVPFATPGTVIAMALIFLVTLIGRLGLDTDFPLVVIAAAYVIKYAAVAARGVATAYTQIDPALEEAARVSGAGTGELLRTIWFPLLKKNLGAAWLLAALPMFTELTMSVLLTGPGAATLGTVLFELQEYRDQPSAAALAWMLLTIALAVGFVTRPREENT